jgi:hypothetical protein
MGPHLGFFMARGELMMRGLMSRGGGYLILDWYFSAFFLPRILVFSSITVPNRTPERVLEMRIDGVIFDTE